jgi:ABC-type enterochelin transport system substrate-binding protein
MSTRWLFAVVAISATLMTGCSGKTTTTSSSASPAPSSKTSAAASSTETSATETAPVTPLDSSQCVTVDGANSDLLTASDKDAARKAADTLEGYNPPASVKSAIEHFVGTGGAHFDDPDYTKNQKAIKDWVAALCPS